MTERVSFEGERGSGKSTVVEGVRNYLEAQGLEVVKNRDILQDKTDSPHHERSVALYEQWQSLFQDTADGLVCLDAERATATAYDRYHEIVAGQLWEASVVPGQIEGKQFLLCDRDIDTTVVYSAAKIILADPARYAATEQRTSLLASLWSMASSTGQQPDKTFYFHSEDAQATLERSHASKTATDEKYAMTGLQIEAQALIMDLFPLSFGYRQQQETSGQLIDVSVDGKHAGEVARVVELALTTEPIEHPSHDPSILPLRLRPGQQMPATIDELTALLVNSSSGAAFPAEHEVGQGFSNCVYSNTSLAAWASELGLGQVEFAQVLMDPLTESCPVHWVALERQGEGRGRIIDATPFGNVGQRFGETASLRDEPDGSLTLVAERGGAVVYSRVLPEDPAMAKRLMQLAYHTAQHQPDTLAEARELSRLAQGESQQVFLGIRLIRALETAEATAEVAATATELMRSYPTNLIVSRELARLAMAGLAVESAADHLLQARVQLEASVERRRQLAQQQLAEHDAVGWLSTWTAARSFMDYYSGVYAAAGELAPNPMPVPAEVEQARPFLSESQQTTLSNWLGAQS